MKLGEWSHLWMLTILKVSSRSPGGHLRSNGLPLLYGHETWWMESSLDAKHYYGHHGSPKVMSYHCCMNMKLGGWSHLGMLTILKVTPKSLASYRMFRDYIR